MITRVESDRPARRRPAAGPWAVAAIALAWSAWASIAAAQVERFDGQPIRGLEFRGMTTLSEETLEHYLFGRPTTEVRRLDLADLNDRIRKLWDRELIEDIEVGAEPTGDGVRLSIRVDERPVLMSVDYVGIKRVSRTDIAEQIDRERIRVYEGQPIRFGELARLETAIEELYKEKGFRFATVTYTLEEAARGQRRATFTIDEGNKVKIGDIDFDGNTVFSDLRLRLAMRKTKESGLIQKFSKKDIYNPANIEEDLDSVRDLYRKAGFKDVLVAKPEIEVVAKRPNAPTIKEQKRRLAITIPVEEGERWRLGEISIDGNEVYSDEFLLRQFNKPRGGWLRSKVVDDAVETIKKLYSSVGYIFASIDTELKEKPENVADVVVRIDEADQYRVGRMEFEGNTKTRDKVLRREMLVQEGTVMNMTSLQNSLLKIRQLNYFAVDEEEPIKFDFDAEEKTVDLKVRGEEAERTELQFGGGFSELDGFFGQFAMRTANFLGRGETVGVSIQVGGRREVFDLEYRVPWLFDKPQTVGFRAFSQELDNRVLSDVAFRQQFTGGSVTYGRSLRNFQSFSFTYSFADVEDVQTLILAGGEPVTVENIFTNSSLRPVWLRNTLDSRFNPTHGSFLSGSVEFAGSFLGGDTNFVRPEIRWTRFNRVSRRPFASSFGFNIELGYLEELEEGGIFPQQRYFLGGDSSVRGFRSRSIVVRDEDGNIIRDANGFPLGGTQKFQLNLEYHMIAGGPFRVVLFGDAGGVFSEEQDFDTDLLRYSAGAELRIQVPLFPAPLRFIYALNLRELEDDQFESFDFSLSTSF